VDNPHFFDCLGYFSGGPPAEDHPLTTKAVLSLIFKQNLNVHKKVYTQLMMPFASIQAVYSGNK
jgi:hypothetical protein